MSPNRYAFKDNYFTRFSTPALLIRMLPKVKLFVIFVTNHGRIGFY